VETEVQFSNSAGHNHLAGTLTVPKGSGPFPAVVLISGTGHNTRDEDVWGHKVFVVLADTLSRIGIAVLRYDKRGVGSSSGDYDSATTYVLQYLGRYTHRVAISHHPLARIGGRPGYLSLA
jgi:uncharacterized protein